MCPMRFKYWELGVKLIELDEIYCFKPKQPPTVEEKRDDVVGYHIKLFLEETVVDVFVNLECIHLYNVPQCLFWEVSVM